MVCKVPPTAVHDQSRKFLNVEALLRSGKLRLIVSHFEFDYQQPFKIKKITTKSTFDMLLPQSTSIIKMCTQFLKQGTLTTLMPHVFKSISITNFNFYDRHILIDHLSSKQNSQLPYLSA